MDKKAFGIAVLCLSAFILYCFSAISIEDNETHNISIDAAKPINIVKPFEISIVGDSGERGLRIGAKVGRGWRGEAGGLANYRFYAPKDGTYYVWAYCLWHGSCENAIFAKFGNVEKAIIGNDPILNQWHWVRGFNLYLKKGTHNLELSNHSDNIAVQKLFMTTASEATPDNAGEVFSDIFYDGFDGCDQGNFSMWKQISGKWKAFNPCKPKNTAENILTGESKKTAQLQLLNDQWADYSLHLSVHTPSWESPKTSVGICFGMKTTNEYYELLLRNIHETETVHLSLLQKTEDETKTLGIIDVPWSNSHWHEVEIRPEKQNIIIQIDDLKPFKIPFTQPINGGIELKLEGKMIAHFDNIHIRQAKNTAP